MSKDVKEEFVEGLQKTGLSYNEATIYFFLIQHGKRGTYVKDLIEHSEMKRTTIYTILKRLIEMGCVIEADKSNAPNKVKIFIAASPKSYVKRIIQKRKRELQNLEIMNRKIGERLETLYLQSMDISYEDIDDFLKPYLNSLIENNWKVIEHIVEKSKITSGFEAYDCSLLIPEAKIVKDAGFIVFKYDYNVEKDENTLDYMYKMLKRKGEEEVLNKGIGVIDVKFKEAQVEIFSKNYPAFKPEFKFEQTEKFIEMTETVMIPIKDKIFCLWAENHKFILEMADAIFKVEKKKKL